MIVLAALLFIQVDEMSTPRRAPFFGSKVIESSEPHEQIIYREWSDCVLYEAERLVKSGGEASAVVDAAFGGCIEEERKTNRLPYDAMLSNWLGEPSRAERFADLRKRLREEALYLVMDRKLRR